MTLTDSCWRDDRSHGSTNPFDEDDDSNDHPGMPHSQGIPPSSVACVTTNPFDDYISSPDMAEEQPNNSNMKKSMLVETAPPFPITTNGMEKNPFAEDFADGEHKTEEFSAPQVVRSTSSTMAPPPPRMVTPLASSSFRSRGTATTQASSFPEQPPTLASSLSQKTFAVTSTALTPLSDVENQLLTRLNHQYNELDRPRRVRSSDVPPLRREYETMRKQLRAFLQAARRYKEATKQMAKAKETMTFKLAALAKSTPLAEALSYDDTNEPEAHHQPSLTTLLLGTAQDALDHTAAVEAHVVDYCTHWERCMSRRLDAELKCLGKLKSRLEHYQDKVERLRKYDKHDKLKRNETKLGTAWTHHESQTIRVCYMLEEVTIQGWKELYPLLCSLLALSTPVPKDYGARAIQTRLKGLYEEACAAPPPEEYDAHLDAVLAASSSSYVVWGEDGKGEDYDDNSSLSSYEQFPSLSPLNTYREDHLGKSPQGIADVERL